MSPADQTFTYRGRSLEELVPRIRQELGDDAVIVARRETTSGGVGGFFAKREIEVEVRPGESALAAGVSNAGDQQEEQQSAAARAFAQQLQEAQQQRGGAVSASDLLSPRPVTSPEVDALPSSSDVTVDDLFPAPPPAKAEGLAALFNAGKAPAAEPEEREREEEPEAYEPEPIEPPRVEEPPIAAEPLRVEEPPPAAPSQAWVFDEPRAEAPSVADDVPQLAAMPEPAEPITFEWPARSVEPEPAAHSAFATPEPVAEPEPEIAAPSPEPQSTFATPEPVAAHSTFAPPAAEQPTGMFDYVGIDPATVEPETTPASAASAGLPAEAREAVARMADRGLRPELAEAIAEEAMSALHPLLPSASPKDLMLEALARRIPMQPLRRGAGVVGFVGPAGAGKTRCVARLAAAHARHGSLPVTVVALRSPDEGAELTRLLAPYGVTLHAVDSGAEGAARIASLRGEHLVVVDTPGVSPRSSSELRALRLELDALAPDELHLTVTATVGPAAARELVRGVRELGVGALVVTHSDETEMLGTVVGLAIDCSLPMSYLARGQAVDAGLQPASATTLAGELLP